MTSDGAGTAPAWSGTARVVRGGTVLEEVSAGAAREPGGPPCRADLRHQAGSISKLVVSVAALVLAERRALSLDDRLVRFLPSGPSAPSVPSRWDEITVGQLLGQTSGIGHWGDLAGVPGRLLVDPPSRAELVRLTAATPLLSAPGSAWRYSGPGFLLAALVVEAVTGTSYGEAVAELVLRPAGLVATTSGVHPPTDDRVALPHRAGEPVALREGFTDLPGTGDLWTTVGDLVTLNQALRAGVLLEPAAAARLWTARATCSAADQDGPVVVERYGLGTFLGRVVGRPARVNPGDNPGYQSLLAHLPDDDLDVVVLCNDEAPAVAAALSELSSLRDLGTPGSGDGGQP